MTKTQFEKKFRHLWKNISRTAGDEATRLFKSGAIDTTSYEDDFLLPMVIICAIADNMKSQHTPVSDEAKKDVANLRFF